MMLRSLILLAVWALAALSTIAPASALSLAVKQAIGLSASSPPPDYGIDFRLGSAAGWSNTRASTALAANNAGVWTDFATTTIRVTDRGALLENSRTNIVKHSSDLTNVVISGTWYTGTDEATAKDFGPGSVVFMPGNWVHVSGCRAGSDCVFYQDGKGRFDFHPVSADPSH